MANEIQVKGNVGDKVIARLNQLCEAGFTMPRDYEYQNAIKMSFLKLQEVKDKNGQGVLSVCSEASVSSALFKMATKGLNLAYDQAYAIIRGNTLCLDPSYYGKILMVKRIYPDWIPAPVVVREGDVFEFGVDPKTGFKFIIKHETKLENMDKEFVAGYLHLPTGDVYIMTRKMIMSAWNKSSNKSLSVHKEFSERMVGKTLVNSGCSIIINSTPQYRFGDEENEVAEVDEQSGSTTSSHFTDFVEVEEEDIVEKQPEVVVEPVNPVVVEVKEEKVEPTPVEAPKDIEANDDFDDF